MRSDRSQRPPTATAAVTAFRSYCKRYRFCGSYLGQNLNYLIRCWLADPARYEVYGLDHMLVHDQVKFIASIEWRIRRSWYTKSTESRARAKRRKLAMQADRRQQSFNF